MNFFKKIKCFAFFLISILTTENVVFASYKYIDVPKDHWAYESIMKIAEKGYIVGNTAGEYKGNNPLDKFETIKILSMIEGYKYIDIKEEEKEFYNKAYNNYKKLLEKYRNKFTRWNTTADREIAYLLEKKILLEEDLEHFIILNEKKQEQLRALSRQEAAVFLVRLMNKSEEALKNNYDKLFVDDKNIDKDKKPYIYFLKKLGVVYGDNNNNFVPNGPVTKAAFAVMIDKSLDFINENKTKVNNNILVETIVGKIENIYPSIKSIHISFNNLNNRESKIYKVSDKAKIYLNDSITNYENIKKDMSIIGTISNNELIDIRLKDSLENNKTNKEEKIENNKEIENENNKEIKNENNKESNEIYNKNIEEKEDTKYSIIDGTISYIYKENNKDYVGIEIKIINPAGGITSQVIKYTIDKDTKIFKGNKNIKIYDIKKDDIVKAKIIYNKVYNLDILEKNRKLQGKVKQKFQNEISKSKCYVIIDDKGNEHNFNVLDNTLLERQGFGKVTWDKIKIGDIVDITAEYTNLLELYAYGDIKIIEGTLEEIYMKQNLAYLKIKNLNGTIETCYITNKNININNFKLGDKIKLKVDSEEIEDIINGKTNCNYIIKGKLDYISENKIILEELYTNVLKTIYYDKNTNITDFIKGTKIYLEDIKCNSILYVYLDDNYSNYAKNINILLTN